ncbi:MAG: glycosyltransferase [Candidatus Rokubacteria bacterium]|nr:glycosyltransferase [Candidatus Rokubacteria bacterium]
MRLRVAILSVHTCPLAALGGKETGGMNVYVRATARELGRMGVHVDVFTRSQNPGIRRVVELGTGARVIHLPAGPEAPMAREVVHRHLHEFVDGVEAHRRAEGLEYDLVHGHYWLSGVAGLALRESWGVPLVQMFHTLGRLKNSVAKTPAEVEPEIRLSEEDRIVRLADRVVAANVVERAHLAWYYGASTDRIAVIPCGVDTELFRPMPQLEAKRLLALPPDPLLLYVGRLQPIKGLETLLEAMTALDGAAQLLIVGGDQDEPENGHADYLRERVSVLGLRERVSFLGAQPQERLRLFYAAADATVMPSYYESFGMVALEAMACGSPVIASRVGGLTTTVRDGVTGFLVPEGDAGALAERVALLLEDRGRRAQLGREAQRWAAEHRWPCVAEAVCRLYSDLRPSASGHLARARCRSSHGSS